MYFIMSMLLGVFQFLMVYCSFMYMKFQNSLMIECGSFYVATLDYGVMFHVYLSIVYLCIIYFIRNYERYD
jgi:hypothetical protein